MWSITPEDAIEMYKRFLLARYRDGALEVAVEQASLLSRKGDLNGSEVWNRVVAKIRIGRSQSSELTV